MSDPDLARRLVACPRFRWMEGMRIASPPGIAGYRAPAPGSIVSPHALPDLDDAATVGCLLALVREVHQRPDAYVRRCGQRWGDAAPLWGVYGLAEHLHELADKTVAPTEAAALVAALEMT